MRILDADVVASLGSFAAIQAITDALVGGLDPAADPARIGIDVEHGQLLLMPSRAPDAAGVKVVTVAPENPAHGLPRIQAAYLLFDAQTLALQAVLDGTALTTLRTPAVSVAAVLSRLPDRPLRTCIIGAGPQGVGHAAALASVRPIAHNDYVVRHPERAAVAAITIGSPQAEQALRQADVIVCATTARTPLFDSALVADDAIVIVVGTHEVDAREVDAALLNRATVIVEDTASALREGGDVIMAIAEGMITPQSLVPMRAVVTGEVNLPASGPVVFKGSGMAWQDLVVARAVVEHAEAAGLA